MYSLCAECVGARFAFRLSSTRAHFLGYTCYVSGEDILAHFVRTGDEREEVIFGGS